LMLSSKGRMDIFKTLSPFMIIFDQDGKPLASNIELNGKIPVPPIGVFDNAKLKGENRLTWQLEAGVRIAAVIVPFNSNGQSGFILAGRSLRESENIIDHINFLAFYGWLATMICSFLTVLFVEYISGSPHPRG